MQSVYTALVGRGGMLHKLYVPDEAVEGLYAAARETGLFQPAGRELRYVIDRPLTKEDIDSLLSWCERVVGAICTSA